MADKKQITFREVGQFNGPIQNGQYENWEASATIDDGKGGTIGVVVGEFAPSSVAGIICGTIIGTIYGGVMLNLFGKVRPHEQ